MRVSGITNKRHMAPCPIWQRVTVHKLPVYKTLWWCHAYELVNDWSPSFENTAGIFVIPGR